MSQHTVHIHGIPGAWQTRCTCKARSPVITDLYEAETWRDKHLQDIERLKAIRSTRNPSLTSQRNYYQEMADSPANTERDRALWQQLADGLTARIGTDPDQPELF